MNLLKIILPSSLLMVKISTTQATLACRMPKRELPLSLSLLFFTFTFFAFSTTHLRTLMSRSTIGECC